MLERGVASRRLGARLGVALLMLAGLGALDGGVPSASARPPGARGATPKKGRPSARPARATADADEDEDGEDLAPDIETASTASGVGRRAGVAPVEIQRAPRAPTARYAMLDPAGRSAELQRRQAAGGPLPVRLERVTRGLVGAPYLLSALGEAGGVDPDPRLRVDAFDCTTFVETALALSRADDWADAAELLDAVRYAGGEVHFEARRHLIAAQWLPGLAAAGWLEDVTRTVGGAATATVSLELDAERWARRRVARGLDLPATRLPFGTHVVPILPVAWVLDHLDRIPPGTVLSVVRAEVAGAPVVVTHQGLVVTAPGRDTRLVRHASPVSKRVIDEPLGHMMRRYTKPRKWPILGINLQRVL